MDYTHEAKQSHDLTTLPDSRDLDDSDKSCQAICHFIDSESQRDFILNPLQDDSRFPIMPRRTCGASWKVRAVEASKRTKGRHQKQSRASLSPKTKPKRSPPPYDFNLLPVGTPDIRDLDPSTPPPRNQKEAKKSPYWQHYLAAEKVEVLTLQALGTGELAKRADARAEGCKVLRGRWVYDHKKDPSGIMFAKARYTVMGCFQTEGVDYGETFAPVMNLKTFRTILQLVNLNEKHIMESWDVKGAFLYSVLKEKVFCEQPPGHETSNGDIYCWLLKKSIYGLHQASHDWNEFLKTILVEVGLKPIPVDPGTYLFREGNAWLVLCIHVDDIYPAYNPAGKVMRDKVLAAIQAKVELKILGEVDWALKTRIHRDKKRGILKISQENFVWEMLTRHGFLNIKGADTPTEANVQLPAPEAVTDEEASYWSKYPIREIIGCLLWLAMISRPDIMVAVHEAARVQHRPSHALWKWIVRIARYLKKWAHLGLVFVRPTDLSTTELLEQWVDVSFAPQPAILRGKSVIGYIVKFLGATTTWQCMKSKRTLDSSSEAECNGVNEVRKENAWQRDLQSFLRLFKVEKPTLTHEDNTATIALGSSATYHKRSKHFGIEWYATKEAIELKELELHYINTAKQLADSLTKCLVGSKFVEHREGVMGPMDLQEYFGKMTPPDAE